MIFDQLSRQAIYRNLLPGFDLAFDYLLGFTNATPDGKYPLDGDRVFALVQSYTTADAGTRKFESHRNYIDLQFVAEGEEVIYHTPVESLKVTGPYDTSKDCTLYSGPENQPLIMHPQSFVILLPNDGHKPCCRHGTASKVKKVVLKIRL